MPALVAVLALAAGADAAPGVLRVDGKPRRFEVKVAGGSAAYRFTVAAGCRYRITVEPGTLQRLVLEIGRPDEEPFHVQDVKAQTPPHVWYAERDALLVARIKGFSASTGDGRVRLEVLGPDDEPIGRHRRYLGITGDRALVGEMLVGEHNLWYLVVEEGRAYEITPTTGSAGRVRLRVLDWSDEVIADSEKGGIAWVARPPLRFRVPPRPAVDADGGDPKKRKRKKKEPAMRLDVRGVFDGGGTYGVTMRALGEDEAVETPAVTPPAGLERGAVEGEVATFHAGPGDLAMVYVGHAPEINQIVQVKRGDAWVRIDRIGRDDVGRGNSARSPEDALTAWFQPYYPGTYRFVSFPVRPPSTPQLFLMDRAALGGAPIHMGTGSDPTPRARLHKKWRLVGLGVVMPGQDYLFVCVHGPDQGVAMRVRSARGKTIRTRAASGQTISPGLGPSLRFKVSEPGIYRLEAKSARPRVVRPLLRRASN